MAFRFPDGFLLGVASAATQIEGGHVDGSWHDWYRRGHIKDGSDPAVTTEHYKRYREDTQLMADLGLKINRFGIDWARIMPTENTVDEEAITHYRDEITLMLEKGIRPLMTLHHFTNPMWFERKGAFLKRENLHYYTDFVALCAEKFGDLVAEFVTINEPNVYAINGYMDGSWPPGHKSMREYFIVLENMAHCHIEAYHILHETRRKMGYTDTMVGFANHLRAFDPKNPRNPYHSACTRISEWSFQSAITRAMTLGKFTFPLRDHWNTPAGEYADFHGVNYYTRSTCSSLGDGVRENSPRNDLNWEIYPEGLIRCARMLHDLLPRPLWVTENGTCDELDRFRCRYIAEHLQAISESGLPFARYYHWCFCDNFEWLEGMSGRFGLVHMDTATQKRTPKRSAEFYTKMIENGGVTEQMWEEYVADQVYDVR